LEEDFTSFLILRSQSFKVPFAEVSNVPNAKMMS